MMRLMTAAELTAVTEIELSQLYRSVAQGLVLTQRNTAARRNALARITCERCRSIMAAFVFRVGER